MSNQKYNNVPICGNPLLADTDPCLENVAELKFPEPSSAIEPTKLGGDIFENES